MNSPLSSIDRNRLIGTIFYIMLFSDWFNYTDAATTESSNNTESIVGDSPIRLAGLLQASITITCPTDYYRYKSAIEPGKCVGCEKICMPYQEIHDREYCLLQRECTDYANRTFGHCAIKEYNHVRTNGTECVSCYLVCGPDKYETFCKANCKGYNSSMVYSTEIEHKITSVGPPVTQYGGTSNVSTTLDLLSNASSSSTATQQSGAAHDSHQSVLIIVLLIIILVLLIAVCIIITVCVKNRRKRQRPREGQGERGRVQVTSKPSTLNDSVHSDEEYITVPQGHITNGSIPSEHLQHLLQDPTIQADAYSQIGSDAENVYNPELCTESGLVPAEMPNEESSVFSSLCHENISKLDTPDHSDIPDTGHSSTSALPDLDLKADDELQSLETRS